MVDSEISVFIKGESINLLPFNLDNIKLYIKWENNPKVRKYSRNIFPITAEGEKKMLEAESKERIIFEIWYRNDKKPIGFAELNDINWNNRRAEIGLLIGEPEYWNRNLGTEAGKSEVLAIK